MLQGRCCPGPPGGVAVGRGPCHAATRSCCLVLAQDHPRAAAGSLPGASRLLPHMFQFFYFAVDVMVMRSMFCACAAVTWDHPVPLQPQESSQTGAEAGSPRRSCRLSARSSLGERKEGHLLSFWVAKAARAVTAWIPCMGLGSGFADPGCRRRRRRRSWSA